MDDTHQDYPLLFRLRQAIERRSGGGAALKEKFPDLIEDALDFVLDPVRTARTEVSELDKVEKTFIGLKVEHFLRDFLDIPPGLRDLEIDGIDLDVKNTIGSTWTIPPETYRNEEPCLLVMIATGNRRCSLGLIVARSEYLNPGSNRDEKRTVKRAAFSNVMWLVEDESLPVSDWSGIDMLRFREIRTVHGGTNRAVLFFRENLRRPVSRRIVQALLYDQSDYMKRLRTNGGARSELIKENIVLLSGMYHSRLIQHFGIRPCNDKEFVSASFNMGDIDTLREFEDFCTLLDE